MRRISLLLVTLLGLSVGAVVSPLETSAAGETITPVSPNGFVTFGFSENYGFGNAVVMTSSGTTVVVGNNDDFSDIDFALAALLPDGSADLSFGYFGSTIIDFDSHDDSAEDAVIDDEGRIVVVGSAFESSGTQANIALARLTPNGELDTTFGTNGKVTLDVGEGATALAVDIDTNGRIVVAGYKGPFDPDAFVARFTESGAPDTSFNTTGFLDLGSAEASVAYDLIVQPDNSIVIVGGVGRLGKAWKISDSGSLDNGFVGDLFTLGKVQRGVAVSLDSAGRVVVAGDNGLEFAVLRLTSAGEGDATFGTDGVLTYEFEGVSAYPEALTIDQSGNIVVAGETEDASNHTDVALLKVSATGSPLWSTELDPGARMNAGNAVAIDSDGVITVAGTSNKQFLVAQYLPSGVLDETYAANWGTSGNSYQDDHAYGVVVDSQGRTVIAGTTEYSDSRTDEDVMVLRFLPDGSIDESFGSIGRVIIGVDGDDFAYDVAVDSNDRVVVVGQVVSGGTPTSELLVARINEDGTPDTTFDGDGIARTAVGSQVEGWAVATDASGRIVAVGTAMNGATDFDAALFRFTDEGDLDSSFGGDGIVLTDVFGDEDVAKDVVIDESGRIVVTGYVANVDGDYEMLVARYLESGALDGTFGSGGISTVGRDSADLSANALSIDVQGRMLIAGSVDEGITGADLALVRLLSDGSIDTSFGTDGFFVDDVETSLGISDQGYSSDYAEGVVVTPEGKITLVARSFVGFFATTYSIAATYVLDSNGELDSDFANGGKYHFGLQTRANVQAMFRPQAVALDGRDPVVVGWSFNGYKDDFAYFRVDGSVVPSAPRDVSVVGGDGELVVSWVAPVDDGGASVSGYVASTSSGESCSTSGLSCTISGLTNGVSYSVSVVASNVVGAGAASVPVSGVPDAGEVFVALTPARIMDTRSGDMVGELDGSGAVRELQVTGAGGVPLSGVSAVALNVTAVSTETNDFGGFVTVFPCGTRPDASNLNFTSGMTIPNSVIAPVSGDGKVCFYVYGKAHLLADVSGYFVSGFEPLTPARIMDTRSGDKVGELDGSGAVRELQVTGQGGVPLSGVSAVALNVTAVSTETNDFGGFVTVFPCGTRPDASNLNFTSGMTIPNSVIAPVSSDGKVCFYVYGKTHLLADVSGYFSSGFESLTPARIMDTRSGDKVGELDGSGSAYELQVTGAGGVPSSGVSAVALNVTAVSTETNDFGGFVTVFPCGTRPDASNLNFTSGMTIPNSVIAPVSDDGKVCFYVYGKAHLLADVSGYFG